MVTIQAWEALKVATHACREAHAFDKTNLGAGMARLECADCGTVVIDLDATEERPVTTPGLFGPSRPTIFSVLAEEERDSDPEAEPAGARSGPSFAFRPRP